MATKIATEIHPDIQAHIIGQVVDSEYRIAKSNQQTASADYESYVGLLDSLREPKQYDWMSDIRLPEFQSRILTQSSIDVSQYFQTRDFVEAYLEDEGDGAKKNSEAAMECINRTLNQRHLFHYQKFVRAKIITHINGVVYLRCWWEQKMRKVVTDYQDELRKEASLDLEGNPVLDELGNPVETMTLYKVPVMGEEPVYDRFNYDVLDPRNVFTDNEYVYSLQQKKWVIIRSEATYEDLKSDEERMGYFGLDGLLEEVPSTGKKKTKGQSKASGDTETSRETYNKTASFAREGNPVSSSFDILERHGGYWAIVTERDKFSEEPIRIKPGINGSGQVLSDAEFIECIMTFAISTNVKKLIRFQVQPYHDATGNTYRPIIRGLCYIHPVEDSGTGDGKMMREIQLAIDDTFNVSNDRVILSTLPTLIASRNSMMDNETIRLEPGHVIQEEKPGDVRELKLSSDTNGALNQIGMLQNAGDKAMNVFPTTMGQLPSAASTTATAVAASGQQSNIRTNYKSLTFENTVLCDFYWMIQQMTFQFAKPETGVRLMGSKVNEFDPKKDYFYKPVSSSIEAEANKANKIRMWTTILGYLVQMQNPKTAVLVNYVLSQIFKYMGDEAVNFGNKLLDATAPVAEPSSGQLQPGGAAISPTSNQAGMPQSAEEIMARGAMNV